MTLSLDDLRTCQQLNFSKADSNGFSDSQRNEFFNIGRRWHFQLRAAVQRDFETIPESTLKELEIVDQSIHKYIQEIQQVKSELQATQKFFDAASDLIAIVEIAISKVPLILSP